MKLSEAILAGCKVSKKAFGSLVEKNGDKLCACALGAGLIGAGLLDVETLKKSKGDSAYKKANAAYRKLKKVYPFLREADSANKFKLEKGWGSGDVEDYVIDRNDDARWSREKIARRLAAVGL